MKPLTFEIVLDGTTSLNGRVDADADNAQTEKEKHGDPFEHGSASALALHLRHTRVITILARDFLRLFPGSFLRYFLQSHRFIFDI